MVILNKVITENTIVKDKICHIYDSTYTKSIYLFGWKIYTTSNVSTENEPAVIVTTTVGFKAPDVDKSNN